MFMAFPRESGRKIALDLTTGKAKEEVEASLLLPIPAFLQTGSVHPTAIFFHYKEKRPL